MSCTICRLPFVPGPICANPVAEHYPPKGMLTDAEYAYFATATGIGKRIVGGINDHDYSSGNMFGGRGSFLITTVVWETPNGTFWMMHTGCAKILRSVFHLEDDRSVQDMTDLFQIEDVFGWVMDGRIDHGKFRGVHYENVGEQIDLRPFWTRGDDIGKDHDHVVFDFQKHTAAGLRWMFTRPDIFPKFDRVIDRSKRVSPLLLPGGKEEPPAPGTDVVTSQPLDVIHVLLPYLDVPSYLSLTGTCKYLRYHAVTTFQPHARMLLLTYFPWAFSTKLEYALIKKKKEIRDSIVESDPDLCSPSDCDWLLYLCKVHWTKSMRVRRYIWCVCEDVKRVYDQKMKDTDGCGFYTLSEEGLKPTEKRKELEAMAQQMFMMKDMMQSHMRQMKKRSKSVNAKAK